MTIRNQIYTIVNYYGPDRKRESVDAILSLIEENYVEKVPYTCDQQELGKALRTIAAQFGEAIKRLD